MEADTAPDAGVASPPARTVGLRGGGRPEAPVNSTMQGPRGEGDSRGSPGSPSGMPPALPLPLVATSLPPGCLVGWAVHEGGLWVPSPSPRQDLFSRPA